jgi:hypothetical protein
MSVSKFFSTLAGPFFWARGQSGPVPDRVRIKYLLAKKHYGNTRSAVHQQDLKARIKQRLKDEHGITHVHKRRIRVRLYKYYIHGHPVYAGGKALPAGAHRLFPWSRAT